jgi:hypothetical protein
MEYKSEPLRVQLSKRLRVSKLALRAACSRRRRRHVQKFSLAKSGNLQM